MKLISVIAFNYILWQLKKISGSHTYFSSFLQPHPLFHSIAFVPIDDSTLITRLLKLLNRYSIIFEILLDIYCLMTTVDNALAT